MLTSTKSAADTAPAVWVAPPRIPSAPAADAAPVPPVEIGGREGPEPTRFGDWEKSGRCIDF